MLGIKLIIITTTTTTIIIIIIIIPLEVFITNNPNKSTEQSP